MSHDRIFFLCQDDEKIFLNFFGRNEKDLFIDAMQNRSISFLIQTMKELRGQKIFILCLIANAYEEISQYLISEGLVENEDFFDGARIFGFKEWTANLKDPIFIKNM